MASPPSATRKKILIALVGLALLTVGYFILFSYGARAAGELLKSLVAQQTSDQYSIDFSQIDLKPLKKELHIADFRLQPTAQTAETPNAKKYELSVPSLELKITSLLDVYLSRALNFERIHIKDPKITLYKPTDSLKTSKISLETGDLYQLISGYLSRFAIDSLGIANASFHYLQEDSASLIFLNDIDFHIKNLLIDSTGSQEKFLFTDAIYLSLTDQSFNLKDSLHNLTFDQFSISTKTGDIAFRNLKVSPLSMATEKSSFTINVPELNFRGLDFNTFYKENHLLIDSVRLKNPTFQLHQFTDQAGNDGKNLPSLLNSLFTKARIGRFYIDNGAIQLYQNGADTATFSTAEVYCILDGVELDSNNLKPGRHQYFEEITIRTRDLTFTPKSKHHLTLGDFQLDSKRGVLQLREATISPTQPNGTQLKSSLPAVSIVGFDWNRLWMTNELIIDSVSILEPNITAKIDTAAGRAFPLSLLEIGNINLSNAQISVAHPQGTGAIDKLSLHLGKLFYNPKDSIQQLDWQFTGGSGSALQLDFQEQSVRIDDLVADQDFRDIHLGKVHITPGENRHPIAISDIMLTGFELDQWKAKQFLKFDTLQIFRPLVGVDLQKKAPNSDLNTVLKTLAHHLVFDQVQVSHGEFRLFKDDQLFSHLDSVSVTLSSFHYDSLLEEYFTGIDLHMDSFHVALPETNHELYGRSMTISQQDSTLDLINLTVVPDSSDSSAARLNLYTDELEIHHLDFHRLINTGQMHFRNGQISRPTAQLHLAPRNTDKQKRVIDKEWLQFEQFTVLQGQIDLQHTITGLAIHSEDLTLTINHLDLTDDQLFLNARSYQVESPHTAIITSTMTDSLRIDHLHAHTGTGYFEFSNIHLEQPGLIDLLLPHTRVTGLNVKQLNKSKKLILDTLHLDNPQVVYHFAPDSLQAQRKPGHISLGHLSINNAEVAVLKQDLNLGDTLKMSNSNLVLDNLNISPDQKVSSLADLFENLQFSGSNLYYHLPDSLFAISLKDFTLNETERTISLNKLALVPLYNKGEFQSKISYQKDWFDAVIPRIDLINIDLDTLIFHRTVNIQEISLSSPYLDTHRDKRLPMPQEVYKPLPQQALRQLPIAIHIDSITLRDAYVSHTEFAPKGEYPGKIYFRNLKGSLTNVTNRPKDDPYMHLRVTGTLMETGELMVSSSYHLTDSSNTFTYMGEVTSMDLTELNEFLEPTAFVKVRDGHNERITFNFEADEDYAVGKMKFYYDDLKIGVLDQESYDTKGFGSSIKSFFANTFVVNTRNPHFLFVRNGDIFHERDHNKSIFNYWAKSVLSGVISSIGAKNTRKEIRQQNDEIRDRYDALDKQ